MNLQEMIVGIIMSLDKNKKMIWSKKKYKILITKDHVKINLAWSIFFNCLYKHKTCL